MGSIPVTACCPKKPRIESMARRPFLISFSFSSSKLDPLPPLDQPAKSKTPPGYPGSLFTSIRFQGMAASRPWLPGVLPVEVALRLDPAHREDLDDKQGLVVRVVLEERGLQPGDARARPLEPGVGQQARHQDAHGPQHGPAGVLELRLAVPRQRLGVLAEAQGVPPEVPHV